MNCAGSHMASASLSNSAGLLWGTVKHGKDRQTSKIGASISMTPSQWAQAVTYGAICMAFGMDRRKGALTFRDAFPATNSPAVFSAPERMHAHTQTPTPRLMQASVGWRRVSKCCCRARGDQETSLHPLLVQNLKIPLKRKQHKRLNLLLKVKYPVTTEEAN